MTHTRAPRLFFIALITFLTSLIVAGCGSGSSSEPPPTPGTPPTISSFTASSSTVSPGTRVTLSWNVANATSMSISDGANTLATGPLPSGSVETGPVNATTTFTLTASNSAGQATPAAVTVTVGGNAPTIQLAATPNPVPAGGVVSLSWTTTNASSITFSPEIEADIQDTGLPVQNPPPGIAISVAQTTTYTATVTGSTGLTNTGTITINVLPPAPTVSLSVTPSAVLTGGTATLNWITENTTALTITDSSGAVIVASPQAGLPTGSVAVTPAASTTYTATVTGQGNQTATTTASITVSSFLADPPSVSLGQSTTLKWNFPNAASVSIDHNIGTFGPSGSTSTPALNNTTTYTATARDANGATIATATAKVTVSGLQSRIKHIIFFVQENRSFDNYFGKLGEYRASKVPGTSPSDIDTFDPKVELTGIQGRKVKPFHSRTVCTDNLSPAWNESHFAIHLRNGKYLMDRFMLTTKSIPEGLGRDPNGDRAMGFYDETDLPYYYELATQFATSDRWFSPLLTNTVDNRYYLLAGTSFGHVHSSDPKPPTGYPVKTIFDLMTEKNLPWRYYYIDGVFYATHFAGWNATDASGNFINRGKVRKIDEWFKILADPNADKLLPPVIFIESGSGGSGLDEHPDTNIQSGAAFSKKIIDALMNSTAWQSSVFIWTFDEAGGVYDHVPPVPMPKPDDIAPMLQPGDAVDDFDKSGLRVPLIVISPWVKKNYVSHTPRDFTAILKLIQDRFGLPPLTKRDAGQASMEEFFDFSAPSWPTPPPLPDQPTTGACDFKLETAP